MQPSLHVQPVTDEAELPLLASIFDEALKYADSFHEVMTRCLPMSVYEDALTALQKGFHDPTHFIFKAVDDHGEILGISHWTVGYISIPKVDPFANEVNPPPPATDDNIIAPVSSVNPCTNEN